MKLTTSWSVAPFCLGLLLLAATIFAHAAENPGTEIQRRQAIQLEQSQAKQQTPSDTLSASPAPGDSAHVVVTETSCFTLTTFAWQGAEAFPWLAAKTDYFAGQCLGAQSLKRLRDYLTLALLERGFITSRVVYPEQNLNQGVLTLQVIPGRLKTVRNKGAFIGMVSFPLAAREGDLINQRDLDQSLENFRRLQGQAETSFELIPGAELGDSDLLISHGKATRVHGSISLDDAGSQNTGKHQLSVNLSIDSALRMYDSLALTFNSNANFQDQTLGNRATALQWSVPLGYGSVFFGINQSNYKQTVAGFVAPIEYTGNSQMFEVGTGFVPYRAGNYKGQSQLKTFRKISQNFIDEIEIGVQARDVLGWELSHQHKHLLGQWSTHFNVAIRASLPTRSNNNGVLLGEPDWNGYYRVDAVNLNAERSFAINEMPVRYQTQLRWQHCGTSLPSSEYFSIGGRYSVRGFDGENTLSAESGGYWRNEFGLGLPHRQEAYLALDAGRVKGKQSDWLTQKTLAGAALGLRGVFWKMSYDFSMGWPIVKPHSFTSHPVIAGSISFQFNG